MNPRLRYALLALALLIAAAAVGVCSGSRRARASEAAPRTPLLDVAGFRSVELLPPERRAPWLDASSFARPAAPDPRAEPPAAPAAGAAQPAAAGADGARQYRVRENDTMSKIARREYGDANLAAWLLQVNGIQDPTKLGIGDLILLPPAPPPAAAAATAPTKPAPAAAPAGSVRSVVVRKGETLGEIAQREYGSVRYTEALMKANGMRKPEELRAGQTLTLPPL